ncbi:MAG: copper resistance protein CopC [Anaerolineae bacterium]|nr:copper resistance protein CopC [Anaerolineae bacterium]
MGVANPTAAAATLRHSDPRPDSTLDRSPMEVLTWFSMPITAGSDLRIFDADFADMANGKPEIDPDDVTLLRLPVVSLPAGRYTVKWRAEGRDGSITEGEFKFNVSPVLNYSELLPVLVGISAVLITLLGSGIGWWLLRRWIRVGRR